MTSSALIRKRDLLVGLGNCWKSFAGGREGKQAGGVVCDMCTYAKQSRKRWPACFVPCETLGDLDSLRFRVSHVSSLCLKLPRENTSLFICE